jgi:putative transposase
LDVYIEKGHVAKDHVHLLVSVPPNIAVSELVQRLKGRRSWLMLQEFGELKKAYWGQHLWASGYFVASTGNVTDAIIAEYIEKQGQQDLDAGEQDFSVEG